MRPCASDMIHINGTHSFDPKVYAEKRISILFGMVPDMKGNIDFVSLLGPTLYFTRVRNFFEINQGKSTIFLAVLVTEKKK